MVKHCIGGMFGSGKVLQIVRDPPILNFNGTLMAEIYPFHKLLLLIQQFAKHSYYTILIVGLH